MESLKSSLLLVMAYISFDTTQKGGDSSEIHEEIQASTSKGIFYSLFQDIW
jgi:hypothetical protein